MTGIRKFLGLLVAALMLGAFALPALAASPNSKILTLAASGSSSVTVTVTNLTPTGNSNISSFKVIATGLIINSVQNNGASDGAMGAVTIAPDKKSVSVQSISSTPLQFQESYTLVLNLGGGGLTCPSIGTLDAIGYTGSNVTGQTFANTSGVQPAGTDCSGADLACGQELSNSLTNTYNVQPYQPGYAAGYRGLFDKNGDFCGEGGAAQLVDYNVTNTLLADGTIVVGWNTAQDPYAALQYSLNGKARPVTNGWADAVRPQVAWVESAPGVPVFIAGLDCLGTNPPNNNMPGPYGTLATAIPDTTTSSFGITVVTVPGSAILPPAPFPIVIGTERMLVTTVSGGPTNYSLLVDMTGGRAKGGTTAAPHGIGVYAMSTPLPIIPAVAPFTSSSILAYQPGKQAHMCVQEYGTAAYGTGSIYDYATMVDIGDGYVKVGQ